MRRWLLLSIAALLTMGYLSCTRSDNTGTAGNGGNPAGIGTSSGVRGSDTDRPNRAAQTKEEKK
jgi:hypothetical protein